MESPIRISTDSGDFPHQSNWCNYPLITKTNTKFYRQFKGDVILDPNTLPASFVQKTREYLFYSSSHQESSEEVSKSAISLSKKRSRLLIPNDAIVSPWLRFGLEDEPWKESHFNKMPQIVHCHRGRGPLTPHMIASGISNLAQTPDTKAFAVTKLQISNRGLTDIETLRTFRCFQYIDMSWNEIVDLSPLESMVYLMCLNASHNKVNEVLNVKAPWYLTYVSLACNEITFISDLSEFWSLRHIDFSYNHISQIQGLHNLKYLKYLNLSHNDITCIENLGGLMIEELDLESNQVYTWDVDAQGMIDINPQIKSLNLSHNCLETLSFLQGLYSLKELLVSHNYISSVEELDYLKELKLLKNLSLYQNDISLLESYKSILIYYLPQIEIIDTFKVINAEKEAATILFSPELLVQQYRHHAKLLLYEQLTNPSIQTDTQPCGGKAFPIVCLVGPHGCSKFQLAKRLSEEFSKFVYAATNHVMTSVNTKAYERMIDNKFVINEDKFNEMIRLGQFLATSELIGFSYGLSREEFSRSIEEGKLCLVNADLLMAFCLQALGLNPYLILTIVADVDIHRTRIMNAYTDPSKGSLLEIQFDALIKNQKPGSYSYSLSKEDSGGHHPIKKYDKYRVTQRSSFQDSYGSDSFEENLQFQEEEYDFDMFDEIDRIEQQFIGSGSNKNQEVTPTTSVSTVHTLNEQPMDEISNLTNCSRSEGSSRCQPRSRGKTSELKYPRNFSPPTEKGTLDRKSSKKNLIPDLNIPYFSELNNEECPQTDDQFSDESSISPGNIKSFAEKLQRAKRQRQRLSLINSGVTTSNILVNQSKSFNESTGNWSWTSSNDSDLTTEEIAVDEENSRSSSQLSLKTVNYILKKIIDSRKVYQDLQDSGYFSNIIYTDNIDEAYEKLKNVICYIYNTKDDWSSLYSFEKDALYEEVVKTKTTKLMNLLDETESTTCLKKQ